jgi:hypothetical protein
MATNLSVLALQNQEGEPLHFSRFYFSDTSRQKATQSGKKRGIRRLFCRLKTFKAAFFSRFLDTKNQRVLLASGERCQNNPACSQGFSAPRRLLRKVLFSLDIPRKELKIILKCSHEAFGKTDRRKCGAG